MPSSNIASCAPSISTWLRRGSKVGSCPYASDDYLAALRARGFAEHEPQRRLLGADATVRSDFTWPKVTAKVANSYGPTSPKYLHFVSMGALHSTNY